MIVDSHIHIWAPEYIPESMRYNWARLAAHRRHPSRDPDEIFPKVTRGVADPEGTYTMAEMDRAGVDASVSMLVDYSVLCNEEAAVPLIDVMKSYGELQERYKGRFYAFATVDPRRPDAVEIFERGIKEFGLRGLKLYPAAGFYPYDEACIPLYRRCVEWDIPVTFHTSTVESPFIQRYTHPMQLSDVQAMFPDLKVILAHAGKGPWWQEATAVAAAHPHTYLELSMWSEVAFRDPGECVAKLAHMRDTVGAHKILFASDNCAGPATEGERSWLHRWVDFFRELPDLASRHGYSFAQEEVDLILGENAVRVLKLDGVGAGKNGSATAERG
jgi:predicted TIM-barrel fold metal-dependent hydrolase